MGRGSVVIKKIENRTSRMVTFSKRRGGLMKKAKELAILCDAQVAVIVFSSSDKLYDFCHPPNSMREIIERFQKQPNKKLCPYDAHEQHLQCQSKAQRLVDGNMKLEQSIRRYTGEDMSGLSPSDLDQLEEQLMFSVDKVRNRKTQLLGQQVDNLRRKTRMLEDENRHYREMFEHDQHQYEAKLLNGSLGPLLEGSYHQLFPVDVDQGDFLPLSDLRLQTPTLHDRGLHPHYLQLG